MNKNNSKKEAQKSANSSDIKVNQRPDKDFRGLTVFELGVILFIIGSVIFWSFSFRAKLKNESYDETRKARVIALKENLKTYVTVNGTFPSEEQFYTKEIRDKALGGYINDEGAESLYDPQRTEEDILYFPEPEGCFATVESPCEKVSISLTLSDGEEFFRFAIKPGEELKYIDDVVKNEGLEINTELTDEQIEDLLKNEESVPEPGD